MIMMTTVSFYIALGTTSYDICAIRAPQRAMRWPTFRTCPPTCCTCPPTCCTLANVPHVPPNVLHGKLGGPRAPQRAARAPQRAPRWPTCRTCRPTCSTVGSVGHVLPNVPTCSPMWNGEWKMIAYTRRHKSGCGTNSPHSSTC